MVKYLRKYNVIILTLMTLKCNWIEARIYSIKSGLKIVSYLFLRELGNNVYTCLIRIISISTC